MTTENIKELITILDDESESSSSQQVTLSMLERRCFYLNLLKVKVAVMDILKRICITNDSKEEIIECIKQNLKSWFDYAGDLLEPVIQLVQNLNCPELIVHVKCLFDISEYELEKCDLGRLLARSVSLSEIEQYHKILQNPSPTENDSLIMGEIAYGFAGRNDLEQATKRILRDMYRGFLVSATYPDLAYAITYALGRLGMVDDLKPLLDSKGASPPKEGPWASDYGGYIMLYEKAIKGILDSDAPQSVQTLKGLLKNIDKIPQDSKCHIFSREKNRFLSEIPVLISYLNDASKPPKLRENAARGLGTCAHMISSGTIS